MPENAYCDSGSSPPTVPEPFVSADVAARFLSVKRRYILALARRGLPGAYALGTGTQRKTWVFVCQNWLARSPPKIAWFQDLQNALRSQEAVSALKGQHELSAWITKEVPP
jgi:hypothetical protein